MRSTFLTLTALFLLLAARLPLAGADTTVINVPPDSVSGSIGADTIVNVLPGGNLGSHVVENGGIVNIEGGRTGSLTLRTGAIVNSNSGGINSRFLAEETGTIYQNGGRTASLVFYSSSTGEIHGGAISGIRANSGSSLTIHGINFAIDGVPVDGLFQEGDAVSVNLADRSALTGTLEDGTPFGYWQSIFSPIDNGVLVLKLSAAPSPPTPETVIVSGPSLLPFVGDGQTLIVQENGELFEHFRAGPGSRIELQGGTIQNGLYAVGAEIVVDGGTLRDDWHAFDGTVIDVNGGTIRDDGRIHQNAVVNMQGGQAVDVFVESGGTINVFEGSVNQLSSRPDSDINLRGGGVTKIGSSGGRVTITGGSVLFSLDMYDNGILEIAGGSHSDNFEVRTGSSMTVRGGEFHLNGEPLAIPIQSGGAAGISVDLTGGSVLSGVYADGTPFVLSGDQEEIQVLIELDEVALPAPGPSQINVPSDPVPPGVRGGQTLTLSSGGSLPDNFTVAAGGSLVVQGGSIRSNLELAGATAEISAGSLQMIDLFAGSVATFSGTATWKGLNAYDDTVVSIHGGVYAGGQFFRAWAGSEVNITAGDLRGGLEIDEATLNVSGGELGGLQIKHFSNATISGGNVAGRINLMSGSHLSATGGRIGEVSPSIGDSDLVGIATTTLTIDGAYVGQLTTREYTEIVVHHGIVNEVDGGNGGYIRFNGGALGDSQEWLGGTVEINGYDFQVDGVPVEGLDEEGDSLNFHYTPGSIVTGVMSDGTPFNLVPNDSFRILGINDGVLRFIRSAVPTLPSAITVPTDTAPYGAGAGQTVILEDGGELGDNFLAGHDSIVEIRGGKVGNNFEADRSQVTITGGHVGNKADAFGGSDFTVAGGSVGEGFQAQAGSIVHVTGGSIGRLSYAMPGSEVHVSGGYIGTTFRAMGATMFVTGGNIDVEFSATEGSTVIIEDGSISHNFEAGSNSKVDIYGGSFGKSVSARDGASVNIYGGDFEGGLLIEDAAVVDIHGGEFSSGFEARLGAKVNIESGVLGNDTYIHDANVHISGGEIGDHVEFFDGAEVRVSGGSIGKGLWVQASSQIIQSGGLFGRQFQAFDGSTLIIEGFGFELDGVPIQGLSAVDDTLVVYERGGALLTGILADGTPFEYQLNDGSSATSPLLDSETEAVFAAEFAASGTVTRYSSQDYFDEGATVRLVLSAIPEPATGVLIVIALVLVSCGHTRPSR